MQPRTLDQILGELNSTYEPQIASIRQQQGLIPQQIAEEEKGLQAKQGQAYEDILGGARRRGLGFSGIPLQEQAKYSSTEYMPALARLRSQGRQQAMSLEDAILGINERRNTAALGIRQNEQTMAEQQRQFNENLALQKQQMALSQRAASGGGGGSWMSALQGGAAAPSAQMKQRANGGFDFADQAGKPISAARYAQMNNIPLGNLLYQMGASGDKYAQQVYNVLAQYKQMGINNIGKGLRNRYSAVFWGTE